MELGKIFRAERVPPKAEYCCMLVPQLVHSLTRETERRANLSMQVAWEILFCDDTDMRRLANIAYSTREVQSAATKFDSSTGGCDSLAQE